MQQWYRHLAVDTGALPADEPFFEKLQPLFQSRVEERSGAKIVSADDAEFKVFFVLNKALAQEAYELRSVEGGVEISGADFNALVFGMGRFLHRSRYSEQGILPTQWRGMSAPKASVRAIYFAMHFFNWYQRCEPEDIERYIEDLMLWGINAVTVIFPKINLSGWEGPDTEKAFVLLRKIFTAAKKMNMLVGYQSSNQDFNPPNMDVAADKSKLLVKAGNLICPGTEAGYQYLRGMFMPVIHKVADIGIDYISFWSYDEGGCSCEKCWPWGPKGMYNYAKRLAADIRKELPDIQVIFSTWLFGRAANQDQDWPGLYERIREDRDNGEEWIDLLLIETRDHISCKYVLENPLPSERIKMVTFPDIAMMGQEPWGGLGGLVAPRQVRAEQMEYAHITDGCFMYSEGRYDDMNKVLCGTVLWDPEIPDAQTIEDYCAFECPGMDTEKFVRLIELIEVNHDRTNKFARRPADMEAAEEACRLADELNAQVIACQKQNWRWRLLYIRVFLDYIRFKNFERDNWSYEKYTTPYRFFFWGDYLEGDPLAEKLMEELVQINCNFEVDDPEKYFLHFRVRPPLRNGENAFWKNV